MRKGFVTLEQELSEQAVGALHFLSITLHWSLKANGKEEKAVGGKKQNPEASIPSRRLKRM